MTDDQKDPTERDRAEDEDLELDAEAAEDVKGGYIVAAKTTSTVYTKSVKDGNVSISGGTSTVDPTASTAPLGGLNGATS